MKKKIGLLCLVLACVLVLSACGCKHETWKDADCVTPKTCAECGETEGEALGHAWVDADCLNAKTCTVCGETEGEALGHAWADATCETAKTCSACGETEGEALGHTWMDATTEAPMTCEACGATEGDRIITDARFHTADCAPYFGTWKGETVVTGELLEALGLSGMEAEIPIAFTFVFGNAGDLKICVEFTDPEGLMDALVQFTMETTYAQLAASGYNKETADAIIQQNFGMTMEEYIRQTLSASVNIEDANTETDMVYYVENGILYTASNWNQEMYQEESTLDGDTLYMAMAEYGNFTLTRVEE